MKKNIIGIFLAVLMLLSLFPVSSFAIDSANGENIPATHTCSNECGIQRIIPSDATVDFPGVTYVKTIKVFAEMSCGALVDITNQTEGKVCDEEIVTYDRGRIDALCMGTTEIHLFYEDQECVLLARVLSDYNPFEESSTIEPQTLGAGICMERANACYYYSWTPTQDLTGWREERTYYANITVQGLPYSQWTQAYPVTYSFAPISFTQAMGYANFYETQQAPTANGSAKCPTYGLDCSGFLSYCIGTNRKTTYGFISGIFDGTYSAVGGYDANQFITYGSSSYSRIKPLTEEMKATIKNAYASATRYESALVENDHCRLVISNSPSQKQIGVMEQTPSGTVMKTYSYDELANAGYIPFSFTVNPSV